MLNELHQGLKVTSVVCFLPVGGVGKHEASPEIAVVRYRHNVTGIIFIQALLSQLPPKLRYLIVAVKNGNRAFSDVLVTKNHVAM